MDSALPRAIGLHHPVRFFTGPIDPLCDRHDVLVVGIPQEWRASAPGTAALDHALNGALSRLAAGGVLDGRFGETLILASLPRPIRARSLLIIGLGKTALVGPAQMGVLAASAMRISLNLACESVGCLLTLPEPSPTGPAQIAHAARAMMKGALAAIDARRLQGPHPPIDWTFDMRTRHGTMAHAALQGTLWRARHPRGQGAWDKPGTDSQTDA